MKFVISCSDRWDRYFYHEIEKDSFSAACSFVELCFKNDIFITWDDVNLCDEQGHILCSFIKNGRIVK